MKVGLQLYVGGEAATPEFLGAAARAVEERGFAAIWLPEHVVLFPEINSPYPYSRDGSFPFDTTALPMEPFTLLAFMAAQTARVRLATGISILPQRNPVYFAKQAADVDVLSGGRLDIGIGVGWLAQEFEALGVPFERRGARAAEYVQVLKTLWCERTSEFHGAFYDLPACHQSPKPVQQPHPPLWFGGHSRAAMRRVARYGQGWFAAGATPDAFAKQQAQFRDVLSEHDRRPADVRVALGPPDGKASLDDARRYRDLGVEQLVLALSGRSLDRFLGRLDRMAEEIVVPAAGP